MITSKDHKVYIHISPSNKIYVGQTKQSLEKRFAGGYENNPHFLYAINKYGWDKFEHVLIRHSLSKEDADQLEYDLIKALKTQDDKFGYNIKNGGTSCSMTPEMKVKIGASNSKKVYQYNMNGELVAEYSSCHEAANATQFSVSGIAGAARLGRVYKDSVWRYEIDSNLEEIIEHSKKRLGSLEVNQYSLDGAFIKGFKNVKAAAIECTIPAQSIRECLRNKNNTCAGFIWRRKTASSDVDAICRRILDDKKSIAVLKFGMNQELITKYKSISEAARENNIPVQNISKCIRGQRKTAGRYIWKADNDHK